MILLYNLLQLLVAPLLIILLLLIFLRRPEKRRNILARFGHGLKIPARRSATSPTIWVHALSVGEVSSALPLIIGIRDEIPGATLIFSSTTLSGQKLAERIITPHVDELVHFPLDILFVVKYFINRLKPSLFILVETDFWPNLLSCLEAKGIPAILVNGRISKRSIRSYRRYAFFFRPLFDRFAVLCMQTGSDTDNLLQLGIPGKKLKSLGNLKFADVSHAVTGNSSGRINAGPGSLVILCGSTHDGEEPLLLASCRNLIDKGLGVHLVIAPRDIARSDELLDLASAHGFSASLFSRPAEEYTDITIVDTIGDLASLYEGAAVVFIGGSLVPEGGHNPLEAARHGCPILFGPSMEDFSEIGSDLLNHQAAFEVTDSLSLESTLEKLLTSEQFRRDTGEQARKFVERHREVIPSHITVIKEFL